MQCFYNIIGLKLSLKMKNELYHEKSDYQVYYLKTYTL